MTMNQLLALRPAAETSDSYRAALAAICEKKRELLDHIAELKSKRGGTLLRASAAEVAKETAKLAEAIALAEGAEAMAGELEGAITVLERAEKVATLTAQRHAADVSGKTALFAEFYRNTYPDLAQRIATGLRLEQDALAAFALTMSLDQQLKKLGISNPAPVHPSVEAAGVVVTKPFGAAIFLTGPHGGGIAHHPAPSLLRLASDTPRPTVDHEGPIWPAPAQASSAAGDQAA